jgi:membrane associated rhomboid family serine protease
VASAGRGAALQSSELMSTGNPDLFVVCKSCGAEVSPYITECPYCGNRLRKRAPKIDRDGRVTERRRRRPPTPSLPRLRPGEIPGIRPDSRPYVTAALVVLGLAGCLIWRSALTDLTSVGIYGPPGSHWWRLLTTPFVYRNLGYAFVALGTVAVYGWLIERRHGPLAVLALFALGGVGGAAATVALWSNPVAVGANGAALALLIAWAIPDLISLRRREEIDGDLLGTAAVGVVVALMPLVITDASWISDGVGALGGIAVGTPMAFSER